MHFNCWDEHHSHPIENPWPDDHECALDPGPDVTDDETETR